MIRKQWTWYIMILLFEKKRTNRKKNNLFEIYLFIDILIYIYTHTHASIHLEYVNSCTRVAWSLRLGLHLSITLAGFICWPDFWTTRRLVIRYCWPSFWCGSFDLKDIFVSNDCIVGLCCMVGKFHRHHPRDRCAMRWQIWVLWIKINHCIVGQCCIMYSLLGPDSIWRCQLANTGYPIVQIKWL